MALVFTSFRSPKVVILWIEYWSVLCVFCHLLVKGRLVIVRLALVCLRR